MEGISLKKVIDELKETCCRLVGGSLKLGRPSTARRLAFLRWCRRCWFDDCRSLIPNDVRSPYNENTHGPLVQLILNPVFARVLYPRVCTKRQIYIYMYRGKLFYAHAVTNQQTNAVTNHWTTSRENEENVVKLFLNPCGTLLIVVLVATKIMRICHVRRS